MAFRSDIPALILGVLEPRPLHGYQIARLIKEGGGAAKMTEGQIYPHLHKLEEEGLVKADWDVDTGAAPRRVYELTPSGTKELAKQREAWRSFAEGVGKLLGNGVTNA